MEYNNNSNNNKNNKSNNSNNSNNSYKIKQQQHYNNRKELLFFKIFRNKFIFYKIFSNYKYSSYLTYERLVDVKYILERFTNGKEILLDKVKSSSYLVPNSLIYAYQTIKCSSSENILLYTQLFNNYSKYYQIPEEVYSFITSSNKVALKLYIKRLNYIGGYSIYEIGKIIKHYVKENINGLSSNLNGILMLNYLRKKFNIVLDSRVGNVLFKNIFIVGNYISLGELIKLVGVLLEINNSNNNISKSNNGSDNSNGNRSTNSNSSNNGKNNSINNSEYDSVQQFLINSFNNNRYNTLDLNSIYNEVKLFNFTKESLVINFPDTLKLLNFNISGQIIIDNKEYLNNFYNRIINIRNSIYKLVYILYSINNSGEHSDTTNPEEKVIITNVLKNSHVLSSDVYYYFYYYNSLLNHLNNQKYYNKSLKYNNNNNNNNKLIFTNNNNKISIIKEYFKILYSKLGNRIYTIPAIIQLNDLDLLKAIHQEFRELVEPSYRDSELLKEIMFSILSPKILDFYCNDNYYKNIILCDNSIYWQYISVRKTLLHYERLMKKCGYHFLVGECMVQNIQSASFCVILGLLSRSLLDSNETVYKLSSDFSLETYSESFSNLFGKKKLKSAISILNSFKSKSLNLSGVEISVPNSFKLLHWFINNYNSHNKNQEYNLNPKLVIVSKVNPKLVTEITLSSTQYIYSLIFNQHYTEAIEYYINHPNNSISKYSINTPCLHEFLKEIIRYYFNLLDNNPTTTYNTQMVLKDLVIGFLTTSSLIGDFKMFKDLDYFKLINDNNDNITPILSRINLKNLLITTLENNNYDIAEQLLKYTNITNKEFLESLNINNNTNINLNNNNINNNKNNITYKRFKKLFK